LEQFLEAERVAMESRLAAARATEEARLGEVEQRWRCELAGVLANIEREQETRLISGLARRGENMPQTDTSHHSPRGESCSARRGSLAAARQQSQQQSEDGTTASDLLQ
jgi:hypothetical protein